MQRDHDTLPMEKDPERKAVIRDHNQKAIEWLRMFKRTQSLQRFVRTGKFSEKELAFVLSKLILTPKKAQEKNAIQKWG